VRAGRLGWVKAELDSDKAWVMQWMSSSIDSTKVVYWIAVAVDGAACFDDAM
jgi:hypothetical protein